MQEIFIRRSFVDMFVARVGPMLTKSSLKPFAFSLGFVIFLLFDRDWSDLFLLLF